VKNKNCCGNVMLISMDVINHGFACVPVEMPRKMYSFKQSRDLNINAGESNI